MKNLLTQSLIHQDNLSIDRGVWYAIDYYRACKRSDVGSMLQYHVEMGSTFHGYCDETLFSLLSDPNSPTKKRIYSFVLNRGISPSSALSSCAIGLSILDCGTVCYLACYLALRDILGDEKFDYLFSSEGSFPLMLTGDETSTLSRLILKKWIQNETEILPGDICYFCNCKEYVIKHPAGESRGFNVICSDDDPKRYLGFGLSPKGLERNEVEYNLYECFNEDPVEETFFLPNIWHHIYTKSLLCNAYESKKLVLSFQSKKISWHDYERNSGRLHSHNLPCEGKMGLWVYRPNLNRIEELEKAPLTKVRELFSSYSQVF